MKEIAYFDLEVDPQNGNFLDFGCVKSDQSVFHKNSVKEFLTFIGDSDFLCGHNIFQHDLKYLQKFTRNDGFGLGNSIDTLLLSALLFPAHPSHRLTKDEKLLSDERNNPVSDAIKARELLMDEISAFVKLPEEFKGILFRLLGNQTEFACFFRFIEHSLPNGFTELGQEIQAFFKDRICEQADMGLLIQDPVPLAYVLSSIRGNSILPAWVIKNYPDVQRINFLLRSVPCKEECSYCSKNLDPLPALQLHFGLTSFRTFENIPLQEMAVQAAVQNHSLVAIFPTGGGKSITFQLPALMRGENTGALTVVISPLQSLMKDQVDGLERKHSITDAATINGLLGPIERSEAIRRIEEGEANLLYIAPESLRSNTIEQLLLRREIARFVIDEAHCFSAWGQDFRVDYLYIGDFIKMLQEKKGLSGKIPVSCFTATAKQKVIEDIRQYFKGKLNLHLELYKADSARHNLSYGVYQEENDDEKYTQLRMLIETNPLPTIVYVSRTRTADKLAERLTGDGYLALAYHGRMDKDRKTANQNEFMDGKVNIMVATSAFGMGVDKADVGMVIHYNISDSLENYVQEAGRAGRNESISANCYILFDEEDLNRHFIMHNQTKLTIKEIKQVWKAIKELTQMHTNVSYSPLEIARTAGWDENIRDIETRIATAIAALEDAKYVRRGRNFPRVYANSILCQNAQEAIDKINSSDIFGAKGQKENAIRIIKRLFSSKSKRLSTDEQAESRIDYLADQLGLSREVVIRIVTLLRDIKVLADTKDIRVFIKKGERETQVLKVVDGYMRLERTLLKRMDGDETAFHLKELNTVFQEIDMPDCSTKKIRTILNFWAVKDWIDRRNLDHSGNHQQISLAIPRKEFERKMDVRQYLSAFIVRYLFQKIAKEMLQASSGDGQQTEFSVVELKEQAEKEQGIFNEQGRFTIQDVEDALFYLSRLEALRIDGGFMVTYNRFSIDRIEKDNKKQYTLLDYKQLEKHYSNKVQQIHIVGEYARKMSRSVEEALKFSADYFNLDFTAFIKQYFPGSRQKEIGRTLTPEKFQQLFGSLSQRQLEIIEDSKRIIVVAAGPGSGKTKILVHKLASLLLFEDVKPEQLLMLTFSRAAATEFKERLLRLINATAHNVEIKTFHSYCFDLLGLIGNIDQSNNVIRDAVEKIRNSEIENSKITKTVLVIDEAQDMDEDQFMLVQALMAQNEEMRLILVGDDDQNIFTFRGASSAYMQHFASMEGAVVYELTDNFRSTHRIVALANSWVRRIGQRIKKVPGISVRDEGNKVSIIAYSSSHLITPVSEYVKNAKLTGSTGILVKTNEEAIQLAAVLQHFGEKAELIQANEGFNLANLFEVRSFCSLLINSDKSPRIAGEEWEAALRKFSDLFENSNRRGLVLAMAKQFAIIHPNHKYHSDWNSFIRESHIEDFAEINEPAIYVSTIHKAKGKQFDNVVLVLNNIDPATDDEKRLVYVAVTRPKNRLSIHYNGDYLRSLLLEGIDHLIDENQYSAPGRLCFMLGFKDVNLGHYKSVQPQIDILYSGAVLFPGENSLVDAGGFQVVKFSRMFIEKLNPFLNRGYRLMTAKVSFIVYWMEKDTGNEYKIVLPEIVLVK